jgi:nitrite reductase/ring-hydroxylating ferredoxin subunit
MSAKHPTLIKICPSSCIAELGKYKFKIRYRGESREAILIRFKGVAYAYLNQCVHMPRALDCEHDNIFDDSERFLQCSMHSICYDPVTGSSLSEICYGKKLTAIKVSEEGDWVYLNEKRTELSADFDSVDKAMNIT